MLIDSHCHLNFPELATRMDEVRAAMAENKVSHALVISVNSRDYPQVRSLAEQYANFYATVGVHPDEQDTPEMSEDFLQAEAAHSKVVAIGETGLDYHWCKGDTEWQRERFRCHIRAARATDLPLVVHTREAADDTLRVLRESGEGQVRGVMHCFTEDWTVACAALDLGFYLSFSGIVTFKNAVKIKDVAQRAPLDRILVETDSPYLAPMPHRGKPNEPAYVRYVAQYVAELRGISFEALALATTDNFFSLFSKVPRVV